jgi:monoamine oxidase
MGQRLGRHADVVRLPASAVQVVTTGTPGLTPTGAIPPAFCDEARQVWLNVRKSLLAAGACLRDVVSVRAWLTDADDVATFEQVQGRFIGSAAVTSVVVVSQLCHPGMRVQVDVLAVPSPDDP